MAHTNENSLKILAKTILSKLENRKYVVFNPAKRSEVVDALFKTLQRFMITDEDLTNRIREEIQTHSDVINDAHLTETEAFRSRKRALKEDLGENELQGFYFTGTVKEGCEQVRDFLFHDKFIEDVFESDENIDSLVLDTFKTFDEHRIS